ncbi:MAG: hypothetical protein CM15mP115_12010 [Alphaproteobacteria bacterium]|nr:MAG: hypothetical protein CM15mP115_12010 [Alphaproteobacteria bacterium]
MLRKGPKAAMLYFYISSDYGWRKHPVLKKRRFHHGIDLAGTWQETVHAPAPGTVIFAGRKGSFWQCGPGASRLWRYYHLAHLAKSPFAKVPMWWRERCRKNGPHGVWMEHICITRSEIGDKSLDPQLFFDIGHRIGVGGELMLATDTDRHARATWRRAASKSPNITGNTVVTDNRVGDAMRRQ